MPWVHGNVLRAIGVCIARIEVRAHETHAASQTVHGPEKAENGQISASDEGVASFGTIEDEQGHQIQEQHEQVDQQCGLVGSGTTVEFLGKNLHELQPADI